MSLLEQQVATLDDEQRPADPPCVRVDPDLSVADVSDHGHLAHDDVHLPTQLAQSGHQLFRVAMDSDLWKQTGLSITACLTVYLVASNLVLDSML